MWVRFSTQPVLAKQQNAPVSVRGRVEANALGSEPHTFTTAVATNPLSCGHSWRNSFTMSRSLDGKLSAIPGPHDAMLCRRFETPLLASRSALLPEHARQESQVSGRAVPHTHTAAHATTRWAYVPSCTAPSGGAPGRGRRRSIRLSAWTLFSAKAANSWRLMTPSWSSSMAWQAEGHVRGTRAASEPHACARPYVDQCVHVLVH